MNNLPDKIREKTQELNKLIDQAVQEDIYVQVHTHRLSEAGKPDHTKVSVQVFKSL